MPLFETEFGNVLFIHVPKTGGSSIEEHLAASYLMSLKDSYEDPSAPCKSQHYHGEILERVLREVPLSYCFMIVRHPVDKIKSEYLFQTRYLWKFYRRISFTAWLRYNLHQVRRSPFHRDNHFRAQNEFEAFSPEVFRFEDGLTRCFRWLESVVRIPQPSDEIHLKRSRPDTVDIASSDLDMIGAFYHKDFERYGYQL